MHDRVQAAIDPAYWQKICPELHVGDPAIAKAAGRGVFRARDHPDFVDALRFQMERDGYFTISSGGEGGAEASGGGGGDGEGEGDAAPEGGVPWEVNVAAMVRGVGALMEAGWPPSFLLAYDEPWVMAHQLSEIMLLTTGNQQVMDWFFFYVDPSRAGALRAGWAPHRDRGTDDTVGRFRADGTPEYATVWVALSDATPSNSCLMVVPKAHDQGYHGGDAGRSPLQEIFRTPESFQAIRALPCKAGSVISFTHRLLHWGSAADPHAGAPPRVALSFAVADGSFEEPYLARHHLPLPPIELRVALVSAQAIAYCQNEDPGPARAALYWHAFLAFSHEFSAPFARRVRDHHAWLESKHRAGQTKSAAA